MRFRDPWDKSQENEFFIVMKLIFFKSLLFSRLTYYLGVFTISKLCLVPGAVFFLVAKKQK